MKKILIILVVGFMASCSNDDNVSTKNDSTIYGKWYNKDIVVNGVTIPYDDHEICGKDYIEFYDTNKIRSVDVWNCVEELDWIGSFSKVNNTLNIINGEFSREVTILVLSSEILSYQFLYDVDEDGIDEEVIQSFTRN